MNQNINTKALRALEAKATQGPWEIVKDCGAIEVRAGGKSLAGDTQYYPWMFDIEDTQLLVALRNAAPALLDAAERAQASEAIESALQESRDGWVKLYTDANAERDALKAEVERLREALTDAVESVGSTPARCAGTSMLHSPQIDERQLERWRAALRSEKGEVQS